jgi:hypothetical protein
LEEKLKEDDETSQINIRDNINLEIGKNFNLNEYYNNPIVKKLFVDDDNFLFFLNSGDSNKLFFLNKTLTNNLLKKFNFPENNEDPRLDEFIFNNNSDSFFIISGNSVYKSKKEFLFLNESFVDTENVSGLFQAIPENELGKYLIIGDDLYYFNFDTTSKNIQFYNVSNSNTEVVPDILPFDNINYDILSMDLNFDFQNQKLYILLKSESENYLCVSNKTIDGFEKPNEELIDSKYPLPNKILINDIQEKCEVLIYFKDNSLNSYNENLVFLNHYVISGLKENTAVLDIKDVFVNSGKLYLIDNSNNIFFTDLQQ